MSARSGAYLARAPRQRQIQLGSDPGGRVAPTGVCAGRAPWQVGSAEGDRGYPALRPGPGTIWHGRSVAVVAVSMVWDGESSLLTGHAESNGGSDPPPRALYSSGRGAGIASESAGDRGRRGSRTPEVPEPGGDEPSSPASSSAGVERPKTSTFTRAVPSRLSCTTWPRKPMKGPACTQAVSPGFICMRQSSHSAHHCARRSEGAKPHCQLGIRTRRRLDTLDAGRLGLLTGLGLPGSASPCGPCVARRHDFRGSHCDGRPLAGSAESGRLDASATGRGRYDAAPGAGRRRRMILQSHQTLGCDVARRRYLASKPSSE